MQITYYIRNNDNSYNEFCDKAMIKIKKNNQIFYGGVQWGHHSPTDIIEYIQADANEISFYGWVSSLDYTIVIEEPM